MADLMGADLMGEEDIEVTGDDGGGEEIGVRLARPRLAQRGRAITLPRLGWRTQAAPGVALPRESLQPLALVSDDGSPTFVFSGPTSKNFRARPQKPFRGERLVAVVTKNGPSAAGIDVQAQTILVGTQPQTAQIANMSLDIFAPSSFGVRLSLAQAEPGVDILIPVLLVGGTLAGADTITVSLVLIGRTIL